MGGALYLLLRGVPGRAAQISRLAIVPFVALYAAADAIAGLATGILVKEANDGADTAAGAQALLRGRRGVARPRGSGTKRRHVRRNVTHPVGPP